MRRMTYLPYLTRCIGKNLNGMRRTLRIQVQGDIHFLSEFSVHIPVRFDPEALVSDFLTIFSGKGGKERTYLSENRMVGGDEWFLP